MAQIDPVLLLVGCCSLQLKLSLFETQDDILHWHLGNQYLSYQSNRQLLCINIYTKVQSGTIPCKGKVVAE